MSDIEYLGPYKIGKMLGRGGMGTVFAATHVKSGEQVAVKLIAQHVADEPRFRRRFDREVKTLQRLRHDGIVRLIGFGEEEGRLFYSMELVEGESLQARIRREKRLDWIPTIDFAIDICSALKHAHDIGVVHRDLKPANLILSESGRIKLVDFGIAKIFGDSDQTAIGSVMGTADFMAPEQATSSGISSRTDLYALGSVMYAMLSGRPPFTGKSVTDVIQSLTRDRPVPLDLVNPELPAELVELVHELLAKSPTDRPPTALAVMNRLKSMRAGLQASQTVLGAGLGTVDNEAKSPSPGDPGRPTLVPDSQALTSDLDLRDQQNQITVASSESDSSVSQIPTSDSDVPQGNTAPRDGLILKDENANRTHFQTVDDGDVPSSLFGAIEPAPQSSLSHWLAVAMMTLALVSGTGLFLWALQPPTADQLYESAMNHRDTGAMSTFLRRFPEDPRNVEVRDLRQSVELGGVLKRLRTRARLGVTPLDAAEEGFVNAMSQRDESPIEGKKLLQQWLDVYDVPGDSVDSELKELIGLATYERRRLEERPGMPVIDPRAGELLAKIRNAVDADDPTSAKKRLSGIIELYANESWAKSAIEEARRTLQTLD